MTRPDLVPMLLDVSIDPCDGSVHPSLQYVLIRGFSAMGWEQPKAASEDMAMEILKMIRPSSSNLASGGKVASREYPALGDRVATLLEDARCPKVTPAMEEAGRECARSNDPSTFADIFEAMWKARPTARPDTAEARLREVHSILCEPRESQASDNLEGALYDIERFSAEGRPTDSVCINTLKRVMKQLVRAEKALSTGDEAKESEGGIANVSQAEFEEWARSKETTSEPSPPAGRREIVARIIAEHVHGQLETVKIVNGRVKARLNVLPIADAILAALDGGR